MARKRAVDRTLAVWSRERAGLATRNSSRAPPYAKPFDWTRKGVEMAGTEHFTLSVSEAAEVLGISRAFAYELVGRGEIPVVRFGRRVVVPRRALETLLELGRPTSA
jgi:excisionase family DNA binding protein